MDSYILHIVREDKKSAVMFLDMLLRNRSVVPMSIYIIGHHPSGD